MINAYCAIRAHNVMIHGKMTIVKSTCAVFLRILEALDRERVTRKLRTNDSQVEHMHRICTSVSKH